MAGKGWREAMNERREAKRKANIKDKGRVGKGNWERVLFRMRFKGVLLS